jgi:hypothetical protein
MEALLTLIGAFGLSVLLVLYAVFSWGLVSHTFYHWFIIPVFTDLPEFSIIQFIGFTLFINTIIKHGTTQVKDEFKDKTTEYSFVFLMPWLSLFFGWILKIILF